jgi:hypothetical protein
MNETLPMTHAQLELSLGSRHGSFSPASRRPSSVRRPQWWFQRMRQIVDRALDWPPAPPPRPEQTWFPDKDFHLWTA